MNQAKESVGAILLWIITVGGLASTRLPAEGLDITLIFIAGAVGTLSLVFIAMLWSNAPASMRGWVLLTSFGLILVPPAPQAVAAGIPAWSIALLYVVTLHVYFRSKASSAPVVGAMAAPKRSLLLQYLPMLLFVVMLLIFPLVKSLLPLRIRAAFEFQTALEPLVPLVLVGSIVLVASLLRIALGMGPSPDVATDRDDGAALRPSKEVDAA